MIFEMSFFHQFCYFFMIFDYFSTIIYYFHDYFATWGKYFVTWDKHISCFGVFALKRREKERIRLPRGHAHVESDAREGRGNEEAFGRQNEGIGHPP